MNGPFEEDDFNEEDIEDTLMHDLPDGTNDRLLISKTDQEIYESLKSFF